MKTENEKGKILKEMLGQIGRIPSPGENIGNPYSLPTFTYWKFGNKLSSQFPNYFLKISFCNQEVFWFPLLNRHMLGLLILISEEYVLFYFLGDFFAYSILFDDRLQYCKGY